MRRLAPIAALLLLAPVGLAAEKKKESPAPEPPPLGASSWERGGARGRDLVFDGEISRLEPLVTAAGTFRLAILIAAPKNEEDPDAEDAPGSLRLYDPVAAGEPLVLAPALDPEIRTLRAFDLDGDGTDELLLGRQGEVLRMPLAPPGRGPVPLLAAPALALAELETPPGEPAGRELWLSGLGELARYRPDPTAPLDRPLLRLAGHSLPRRVVRRGTGLLLSTARITALPRPGGRPPLFLLGPEARGSSRLLTLILDPAAPEEEREVEAFSRLPEPERVTDARYFLLDDVPVLAVTTLGSEKVNVIAKKRLRVFTLAADRTREGKRPSLAAMTSSRLWQPADLGLHDVDGDGEEDLVVLQPEGFAGKKLIVEAYRGKGAGHFEARPLKTVLGSPLHSWHFGPDLDADGAPDLLAQAGSALHVYTNAGRAKKGVLGRAPRRVLDLGEPLGGGETEVEVSIDLGSDEEGRETTASRRPLLLDLDGDGRRELIYSLGVAGRGVLRIVWF